MDRMISNQMKAACSYGFVMPSRRYRWDEKEVSRRKRNTGRDRTISGIAMRSMNMKFTIVRVLCVQVR
jgi:hypothetical protein